MGQAQHSRSRHARGSRVGRGVVVRARSAAVVLALVAGVVG